MTKHISVHHPGPQSAPAPAPDTYAELAEVPEVPVVSPVVPVRAVEPFPVETRPARTWTTGQVTVAPGAVVKLVDAHPARARLQINVTGTAYLSPRQESTTVNLGYMVSPTQPARLMEHRGAVWVTVDAAAGAPVTASFAAEYLDG